MPRFGAPDFHGRRKPFAWLREYAADFDLTCYTGDFLDLFRPEPLSAQVVCITQSIRSFSGDLLWCAGNHDLDTGRSPVSSGRWLANLPGSQAFARDGRRSKFGLNFVKLDWEGANPNFAAGDVVLHRPGSINSVKDPQLNTHRWISMALLNGVLSSTSPAERGPPAKRS
jgi:hypothetical protein